MEGIIVTGAGPAGSCCAWKLASAGVHCILADALDFPRHKVCGGVLSGRAASELLGSGMIAPAELDDLTETVHDTMTVVSDFQMLRTYRRGSPGIRIVNRTVFDHFLRRRALEAGAEPLCDKFETVNGHEAVFSSGRKVPFDRMVGADGAASTVRKTFYGRSGGALSPALSAVVPLSRAALKQVFEPGLQVFFFSGFHGYGWLFPRRDSAAVGICSFKGPHERLQTLMKKLLIYTGLGASAGVSGAVLPAGDSSVETGAGKCLLAGDAAGLCDRVSGEGIFHALQSGFLAAEAISAGNESWCRDAMCVKTVKQSHRYRKFLYGSPFRILAMHSLARSERWFERYWSMISGKEDYLGRSTGLEGSRPVSGHFTS